MQLRNTDDQCIVAGAPADALLFDVVGAPTRPRVRVERAADLRLRIVVDDGPSAYARIVLWEELAWLDVRRDGIRVIDPIVVADVRHGAKHAPQSPAWWAHWRKDMVRRLVDTGGGPLFDGPWAIVHVPVAPDGKRAPYPRNPADGLSGAPPAAHAIERALSLPALVHDDWAAGWDDLRDMGCVWPLRAASAPDASRVHALRKLARDGTLPPILLFYVSVLGAYLVLDGHDRLHAAHLERVEPPLLAVWPTRPANVDVSKLLRAAGVLPPNVSTQPLEDALRRAVVPTRLGAKTRAWSIPGGVRQWQREVDAVLARSGALDPDAVRALVAP